jgi:hypothetical protein
MRVLVDIVVGGHLASLNSQLPMSIAKDVQLRGFLLGRLA